MIEGHYLEAVEIIRRRIQWVDFRATQEMAAFAQRYVQ